MNMTIKCGLLKKISDYYLLIEHYFLYFYNFVETVLKELIVLWVGKVDNLFF